MGNKNSTLSAHDSYNIYFQSNDKSYKSTNEDLKKPNNTNFVYFTVKNITIMDILNRNIKIYISRITPENEVYEDKFDSILDANPIINKIKDKSYYDIKLHSNDGKYIILRYENMINNKFKVIYID